MSLDVYLTYPVQGIDERHEVYWANITHNLGLMAEAVGLYKPLWRPDEINMTKACHLIEPLDLGLRKLKANPDEYLKYNAANGWGKCEDLIRFVSAYLEACQTYPDADVRVSR